MRSQIYFHIRRSLVDPQQSLLVYTIRYIERANEIVWM
jgi:hypothetical protein